MSTQQTVQGCNEFEAPHITQRTGKQPKRGTRHNLLTDEIMRTSRLVRTNIKQRFLPTLAVLVDGLEVGWLVSGTPRAQAHASDAALNLV